MNTVDLTDTAIAEITHLLANIEYYRAMLGALQDEASRCGYHFSKEIARPSYRRDLPDELSTILERAILRAQRRFVEPLLPDDRLERWLDDQADGDDGYGLMWEQSLLVALWAQGISLLPGPNAAAQLQGVAVAAREARAQRTISDAKLLSPLLDASMAQE